MPASPRVPAAGEAAEQQAILDAEFAAGLMVPPPEDELLADPDDGPPGETDTEPGGLPWPASDEPAAAAAAGGALLDELFASGVIDHGPDGPGGAGFASGSVLDALGPGPVLAAALEDALAEGLTRLADDELAGVMLAWRRCESRAVAGLLAAVGELSRRRLAHPDPHVGEHAGDELAILLTLTGRSAGVLLDQAAALGRLPATMAALRAGRIDRARAGVIAYETALLEDRLAGAVEQLVIENAPRQTTSRLRARLHLAVLAADPGAARRRKDQAARDARVELHAEPAGTASLAGRDLPPVPALAADARIDAQARALKATGIPATLTQLRAAVFLSLLTGQDPLGFLPPPDTGDTDPAVATDPGTGVTGTGSGPAGGQDSAGPDPAAGAGDGLVLRGSVHLTVPLTAWLGLSGSPGEIPGFGPADAGTCRELADRIAAAGGSRWCLSITDPAGHALAHACAQRPPPAGPDGKTGWLDQLKIIRIEAGACSHAREVPGYRIPDSLHHLVKTRQRTCSAPGCGRRAARCDDDHTLPHDQGGRSCECNLAPLCRRHHRAKQTQGWHLEQPEPGVLIWRLPHGRKYVVTPGEYPT